LRVLRDPERDTVGRLVASAASGSQSLDPSWSLISRQAWIESDEFAAWFQARALACRDLLPRRDYEAQVRRIEATIAAAELELEELAVRAEEEALKERKSSSLRELPKAVIGGG
jgi:hypothetical protein